jgi:hypothetical protein
MTDGVFLALAAATAGLWLCRGRSRPAVFAWLIPATLAVVLALIAGFMAPAGVFVVAACAGAAFAAGRVRQPHVHVLAHLVTLAIAAGCFLHVVPGFDNPVLRDRVMVSPDGLPYTQYLNLDKGLAGLVLLGLYVPHVVAADRGPRPLGAWLARVMVVIAATLAVSLALGYLRWDPKLPAWTTSWAGVMLVLTVLPEEAAFRGVIQTAATRRWGTAPGILVAGVAFGLAHAAGGPAYVLAASVAGLGYSWIFATTGSLAAAVLAHAGLNIVHLLFFTYPALAAGT